MYIKWIMFLQKKKRKAEAYLEIIHKWKMVILWNSKTICFILKLNITQIVNKRDTWRKLDIKIWVIAL